MKQKSTAEEAFWAAAASAVAERVEELPAEETFESWLREWRQVMGYPPSGTIRGIEGATEDRPGQIWLLLAVWRARHGQGPRHIKVRTGKRAGKTDSLKFIVAKFAKQRGCHIWITSSTYEHCQPIFNAVEPLLRARGFHVIRGDRPRAELLEEDAFVKTKSQAEPDQLEVDGLDLEVDDESQNMSPLADRKLRPRTIDRKGIRIEVGTPAWSGTYWQERYEATKEQRLAILAREPGSMAGTEHVEWYTADNPKVEIQEELVRERQVLSPEEYAELYEGRPGKPEGLVHPEFDPNVHVRFTPMVEGEPVTLWVDPGHTFYAVVPVQVVKDRIHVIPGMVYLRQTDDLTVIQECAGREWWEAAHLPGGGVVVDVAAGQHRAESVMTTADHWRKYGHFPVVRSQRVSIDAGVRRLRTFLREPRSGASRIDIDPSNGELVREFGAYRIGVNGSPIDRDNHAIKALVYGIVDRWGLVDVQAQALEWEPEYYVDWGNSARSSRRGLDRFTRV